VAELKNEKELNIVEEKNGEVNGVPFMSVTATRSSIPKMLMGSLREVTITITGNKDDYLIELHTGAWLSNLVIPYTSASLLLGPAVGAVAGGTAGLLALEYGRKLKNRIKELVKKNSKAEYTSEKVETFMT
jgi:hypothetical protein